MLLAASPSAAQHPDDCRRLQADSLRADYEEWLRREPLRPVPHDSNALQPLPPARIQYAEAPPQSPNVSINIMTPAFRTELQLAYQSHQLEEQRKAQQGGAMTIGTNLIPLVGHLLRKLFPQRKSKKQREREKLQRVLDNY